MFSIFSFFCFAIDNFQRSRKSIKRIARITYIHSKVHLRQGAIPFPVNERVEAGVRERNRNDPRENSPGENRGRLKPRPRLATA